MGIREPLTRLLELMEEAAPVGWLDLANPEVAKCYRELGQLLDSHPPAEPGIHVSQDGRRWVVKEGDQPGNVGQCRSCQADMLWVKRLNRASNTMKPHPLDQDGKSHFATCPDADKFRSKP